MVELSCINCRKTQEFVVEVPKWICEECMAKERAYIPSYFDSVWRG